MRHKLSFAALLLTTATGAFAADALATGPADTTDEIVVTAPRLEQDARGIQKNALVNRQCSVDRNHQKIPRLQRR